MFEKELIENNYKLVWSVVNKLGYLKEEKEDLFQSGCIGLILAAKKYDASLGNAFSTFAIPYIIGEIKNYLRSKNHIKISKKILTLKRKIKSIIEEDNNLSLQEIAKRLNLSYEDVVLGFSHQQHLLSLENTYHDDESTLMDFVTDVDGKDIDYSIFEIKELFQNFTKQERKLIVYRFYYGLNQCEIAKKLKISQSKVSRMERKITEMIKKYYLS